MYLIKINTEVDKLIVMNCLYTFVLDLMLQYRIPLRYIIDYKIQIDKLIAQSTTEFYEPKG